MSEACDSRVMVMSPLTDEWARTIFVRDQALAGLILHDNAG